MHMIKKCGGLPCDRRKGRGKVAMAAAAALLLFATSAQAAITDFQLDFNASFLTLTGSVDLTNAGGAVAPIAPQAIDFSGNGATGNKAFYNGDLYVDVIGTTSLRFMPTGAHYVNAQGSGGPGHVMGSWLPGADGYGNATPVPPDFGNYGFSVPSAGAFARIYDQSFSPSGIYAPNGPRALSPIGGGVYATSVAPEIWVNASGFQALVSALGNDFTNLTNEFGGGPFPVPLGGTLDVMTGSPVFTPNATIATWDTSTVVPTLTINVNGTLKYPISTSPLIPLAQTYTGQLVMRPRVPEPSSMVLLGFGAVGLLSCAYRARKRRTRTA